MQFHVDTDTEEIHGQIMGTDNMQIPLYCSLPTPTDSQVRSDLHIGDQRTLVVLSFPQLLQQSNFQAATFNQKHNKECAHFTHLLLKFLLHGHCLGLTEMKTNFRSLLSLSKRKMLNYLVDWFTIVLSQIL